MILISDIFRFFKPMIIFQIEIIIIMIMIMIIIMIMIMGGFTHSFSPQ